MQWPDFYPDNCPPEDAYPSSDKVYRLVKGNPPGPESFMSYREQQPDQHFGQAECKACGLSVLKDLADVSRLQKRVPELATRLVAQGSLNPSLGMMKHTPSLERRSHHTWWVPSGAQPWKLFQVLQVYQEEQS